MKAWRPWRPFRLLGDGESGGGEATLIFAPKMVLSKFPSYILHVRTPKRSTDTNDASLDMYKLQLYILLNVVYRIEEAHA